MEPAIALEIVDMTPRFLTFYEAARTREADAENRWRLWDEHCGSDTVARFIFGGGSTSLEREAYFAGWVVVGHLLDQGWTLARLAHVPEDGMANLVGEVIRSRTMTF